MKEGVSLRVVDFKNPNGGVVACVTGRVHSVEVRKKFNFPRNGRVRRNFKTSTEAEEFMKKVNNFYECIRLGMRSVATWLDQNQIKRVEAAFELSGADFDPVAAASLWLRHKDSMVSKHGEMLLSKSFENFIRISEAQGSSLDTLKNLKTRCRAFLAHSGLVYVKELDQKLNPMIIDIFTSFLERHRNLQTRENDRRYVKQWVNWMVDGVHYLDANPFVMFKSINPGYKAISISEIEKVRSILTTALADERTEGKMLPYFVVGYFCGLRPSEIVNLTTETHITLDEDYSMRSIEVIKCKKSSRTDIVRLVPINENCYRWLQLCEKSGFLDEQLYYSRTAFDRIRINAGVCSYVNARGKAWTAGDGERNMSGWTPDEMRHTYATYNLSLDDVTIELLAKWMGSSSSTIRSHYLKLSKRAKQVAIEFHGIMPPE